MAQPAFGCNRKMFHIFRSRGYILHESAFLNFYVCGITCLLLQILSDPLLPGDKRTEKKILVGGREGKVYFLVISYVAFGGNLFLEIDFSDP